MFITKVNSNQISKINALVYSVDMYNRDSLVNLIKKYGIKQTIHSNSYSDIQTTLETENIELLFLDIDIFNYKEIEILKVLKADKNLRNIPLILITTSSETHHLSYAEELGFDEVIQKPTNFPLLKEAIDDLISKYNKNNSWYILNSIEKLLEDNNLDMAIKYILSIENKINNFYIKYLKSLYHYKKKDYKAAIKELKLLLMFKPTCFACHKLLAECYEAVKDKKNKLEALEQVILFSPKNPNHNLSLGKAFLENNHYNKAEKHLKYAESTIPRSGELNLCMANLYLKKKDIRKAKKYIKRMDNSPYRISINELNELGMSFNKAGEKEKALEYFMKAWEISKEENKENHLLLFNLSSIYFEMEKYEKALFYINIAIRLNKDFSVAKKLKSRILLKATLKNNE